MRRAFVRAFRARGPWTRAAAPQAMPFARRAPTAEEIERLEAQSYAALEASLRAGTETEASFRSQFATLGKPPDTPASPRGAAPRDDDDGGAAEAAEAAALAADASAVESARLEIDAAAERIYRASVSSIPAPDDVVEDASENVSTGGRLSLDPAAAAPDMLTDNFTAGADSDDGDDASPPPVLPADSSDDEREPLDLEPLDAAPQPKAGALGGLRRGFLSAAAASAATPDRPRARASPLPGVSARRASPVDSPPPPPPPPPARTAAALSADLPEFLGPPPPPPRPPAAADVTSDPVEPFSLDPDFDYENVVLSPPQPTVEEQIKAWERDQAPRDLLEAPRRVDDDDDFVLVDDTTSFPEPDPPANDADDLSDLDD